MNAARSLLATLGLIAAGRAQPSPPSAPAATARTGWSFELLPKAFQRDPRLEMTVITEVSEPGKKIPPVSPQSPAYYVTHSAGYHGAGDAADGKSLSAPEVESILHRTLSGQGYLPATAEHPPTLALIYFWGAHNLFDPDNDALSRGQALRNILDRATLVGGEKFAHELGRAIQESEAMASAVSTSLGRGNDPDSMNLGAAQAVTQMAAQIDPVLRLKRRSPKLEFLVEQAANSCHYVVVSAYDYASLATKEKLLLWRTRMTVNAEGVSQLQTLPVVIAAAAPFFGRAMAESEVINRRTVRSGQVEIGMPTVVEPAPAGGEAPKQK